MNEYLQCKEQGTKNTSLAPCALATLMAMQSISTDVLRQAYLEFFKTRHSHTVIPGASLIPENDPTVLFTTAGMHPLVPYLLGERHPAGNRLCDVQRCIRTQDIDEVGDSSHLTFFEMLGNWSLGDYFKESAIAMSFEFLTKVLEIPASMLAVTCFAGDSDAPRDEESASVWQKLGIPKERIGFLPKAKNWWGPAGKTGPCGPDTEMFYWVGRGAPQGNPATHENEWLEIWNDVFMQYQKMEHGTFVPLKQQNVDTGMGLERVAAVLQKKKSVYETDRIQPILDAALPKGFTLDNTELGQILTRHARIIADHLRAATFIIADGIEPSNVDQGYVLRRLIRRAVRSLRFLYIEHDSAFESTTYCANIANVIISQYRSAYPHLGKNAERITASLQKEEQQFKRTLQEGLKHFDRAVTIEKGGTIDGKTAFHLYDTYGFPIELTRDLAKERDMKVDETGFTKAFEEHQALSRAGAEKRFAGGLADHSSETTKLHTATHLLNAALRHVLGEHVWQKGSNITAERLRFDFSHPEKMTPEQVVEVEQLVNEAIAADLPVSYHLTTVEGAKREQAIGVFDDRYATEVKVYVIGDPKDPSSGSGNIGTGTVFSKEICGGPHVARTGMIGTFKILKEESSSAGIRRIKAVVSGGPSDIEVAKASE